MPCIASLLPVLMDFRQRREGSAVHRTGLIVALAASVLLLAAWIASAPPASDPDGRFHLVSIWCSQGTNETDCVEIPGDPDRVLVPRILSNVDCFAYQPLRTAACTLEFTDTDLTVLAPVQKANLDRQRPNLYYRTMFLLKGDDFLGSVTRMRAANAATGILLFALSSIIATPSVRRGLHGAWLFTSVPLGLWLLSTTNTGAWMVAGVGTAWANLLTATDPDASPRRRVAAGVLAAVGAAMGLGARTEAAAPIVIAIVAAIILRSPSPRTFLAATERRRLIGGAAALVAVMLVLATIVAVLPETARLTDPFASLSEGLERLRQRGAGNPVLHLFLTSPGLLAGTLGVGWGLGWLDVLVPVHVGTTALGLWSAMLLAGLSTSTRRQGATVGFIGAATVVFVVFTLAMNGLFVGEEYQPRHYLVLIYMVIGFALVELSGRGWVVGRGMRAAMVVSLSLAHMHLLHQNTRRYVTGLRSEIFFDLSRDGDWWWATYPLSPTANWLVGSIAFAIVAWYLSGTFAAKTRRSGTQRQVA